MEEAQSPRARRQTEPVVLIELNPNERRTWDVLRARVASPPDGIQQPGLRDLLLLVPDLAVLLGRLVRDDRVPLVSKGVALLGLGYLLSPVDLLPEVLLGPVGLLDDLLVTGAALSQILNHVHPDVVRGHWSGHGDALEAVQRVTAWSETQLKAPLRSCIRGLRWLVQRISPRV